MSFFLLYFCVMINPESIKKVIGAPLFDSKKLACCITDYTLQLVFINEAFSNISGYSKDDLLGKSVGTLMDGRTFKRALKQLAKYLLNGSKAPEDWSFIHKNGATVDSKVEITHVEIEGKKYILTIALDFTKEIQLEEELSETQKLLSKTEIITGQGSFEFNPLTEEVVWSDGMYFLFGLKPGDTIPTIKEQETYFNKIDIENYKNQIKLCLEGKGDINLTTPIQTQDGSIRYIQNIARKHKTKENWIYGSAKDITHLIEAQLKTEESERKYRLLTESIPSLIWTFDTNGKLNYLNRHGLAFLGKKEKNIKSLNWSLYFHPDEKDRITEKWNYAKETNTALDHVHQIKGKDGIYRWFQVLIFPIKTQQGEVESWIGIANDIDKRIKIEKSLQLSNTRLRSLIDASPVAIYSINTEGVILDFWNPAAEKLLGLKREDALGKFMPHLEEKDISLFQQLMDENIRTGILKRKIARIDKDGVEKILEISGGCVYNTEGEVTEIMITVMDLTEIEQSRAKIQQSLKEKETLLQEIHHRVKNNLAIVVSLLQLQVFRSENENEKYRLTEAQNRVHSIAMVHELLYQSEDFSSVDLKTYYDTLLRTISGSMKVENQKVEFDLRINIDSLNINQAIPLGLLINELATNSLKYAFQDAPQKGLISLAISREEERIFVKYSDNGPGFELSTINFESGLGMKIIDALLSQLDAEYDLNPKNGFAIDLNFEEKGKGPLERAKD